MTVKIINKSDNELPEYATVLAAGMDLRAANEEPILLKPLQRVMIPTGLYVEIPPGCELQVRPRSGLAAKHGITVLNSPGTIDADYRGEIKVILINLGEEDFVVHKGERIAQIILSKHEQIEWEACEELSDSQRSTSGFGSTGIE